MPFKLRVSKVAYSTTEVSVSGELVEGTYIGPEVVSLCDQTGHWISSLVTRHEMLLPNGWPVVPGDGCTLVLHIASPSPDFELDHSQSIVGQGTVAKNDNRVDISSSLIEPGFWLAQLWLYIQSERLPEPPRAWALSKEDANEEYTRLFQRHWDAGVWPFVRLPVDDSRYVEIEYAGGIEHQNRVWIGEIDGPQALLGYDSGHFSFPSFRMDEVLALADRINIHPSAPLLLLPGAYMTADDTLPGERVKQWLTDVPGIKLEFIPVIVDQLLKNVVSALTWTFAQPLGWTNNWKYSQRNTQSPMSILSPDDFRFIQEFFGRG